MTSPETIRVYRSSLIDSRFIHGFPERHGGVSTGARSSLNLGYKWGDDPANVDENRRRVADHVGFDLGNLYCTEHVHGTAVWQVGRPLPEPAEFDGMVCDHSGPILGAFAADCIPLVFADAEAGVCGAAHSGWRGTVNGMGREMVVAMQSVGANPAAIRVALGPCIGPCCFEVGREVAGEFSRALPDTANVVVDGAAKEHVDLRLAMRAILESAGVLPEHIDDRPPCTKCNPDRFFSYRRDATGAGIHMGFIGLR